MKEVLILYNEELTLPSFKHQYNSYKKAFEALGASVTLAPTSSWLTAFFEGEKNAVPDATIFLDKDITAAKLLEAKGHKLFNTAECIRICDDKSLTYLEMYKKGIAIPKTIVAPKTYSVSKSETWCKKAGEVIGYPLVVKECFGSLGMQVFLAKTEDELMKIARKIGEKPFVVQEYLENGAGWDLRVIVAGGEVIGAIKRSNDNDFRANAARGGSVEAYQTDEEINRLAIAAAQATGAFFAGVDLIMGSDGFVVCEVNSNMLFEAADAALGISVAEIIADKIKSIC